MSTSDDAPALAQSFTTGSHSGGYDLLAARLPAEAFPGIVPTVSVYSDNSGAPDSKLRQLSRRPWFLYGCDKPNDYTASDFTLDPDTTY